MYYKIKYPGMYSEFLLQLLLMIHSVLPKSKDVLQYNFIVQYLTLMTKFTENQY